MVEIWGVIHLQRYEYVGQTSLKVVEPIRSVYAGQQSKRRKCALRRCYFKSR